MSKGIPIAVQQTVESMLDKSTPANVRFNNEQVVRDIIDYCNAALNQKTKHFRK